MKAEFKCYLYNRKMAELEIECPDIEAKVTIDINEIESVRQYAEKDEDKVSKSKCMIHLKSGDTYLVGESYEKTVQIWQQ